MADGPQSRLKMVIPRAPWTRALEEGRVRLPGVELECMASIGDSPGRFDATAAGDYGVGENGVRRLALDLQRGAPPTALPVFFGREHMQRNIFVRTDSFLGEPPQLAGRRVGSRLSVFSGTSAGVLMMLEQAYGLDLQAVEWRFGDLASLPLNRMGLDLHPGPTTDAEAWESLLAGELDAVIVTLEPRYWSLFGPDRLDPEVAARAAVRPLIADPQRIASTYRRTGLYPITDLVVVKPGLVAERPALSRQLVDVFSQANALASEYREPDEEALARREVELLGADPHLYELSQNSRMNLNAFLDFLYRLGALERRYEAEDLFVASAL